MKNIILLFYILFILSYYLVSSNVFLCQITLYWETYICNVFLYCRVLGFRACSLMTAARVVIPWEIVVNYPRPLIIHHMSPCWPLGVLTRRDDAVCSQINHHPVWDLWKSQLHYGWAWFHINDNWLDELMIYEWLSMRPSWSKQIDLHSLEMLYSGIHTLKPCWIDLM